jgi:hypothetical protein
METWRIREPLEGRRRKSLDDLKGSLFGFAVSSIWVVLTVLVLVFDAVDGVGDLLAAVGAGSACLALASMFGVWAWQALRAVRPWEDRVRLDDTDLWWHRHHPREPEPSRVTRADIVEVRLGKDDDTLVVRTVDGVDHTVTALGTIADRAALGTAIGDRIASGVARIHPESPPAPPSGWVSRSDPDGTLVWRRPSRGRPWLLGLGVYFGGGLTVAGIVTNVGPRWPAVAFLLVLALVGGVVALIVREVHLTRPGWLARVGRLDAVPVMARRGDVVGAPSRVVALRLRRHAGFARLDATLDDGRRRRVVAGRSARIGGFAGWLAERADLRITGPHPEVIGMTVASGQVNR